MKLTENHVDELYKFARKHYVYFYDVQSELVDHLANDIERIWEEKPNLSFEQARDVSFKKFGIFGFMDVVKAKQKQMNKQYRKILWRFVKECFSVPKIVTTLMVFLFFFTLLQIKFSEYILLGILAILLISDSINLLINRKKFKIRKEKKQKVFLLESMIRETRSGFTGFTFVNLFNIINLTKFDFSTMGIHWVILTSATVTLLCITFYVITDIIPKKAEELLQETYPEYKFVSYV